jgi:hypothetical protein
LELRYSLCVAFGCGKSDFLICSFIFKIYSHNVASAVRSQVCKELLEKASQFLVTDLHLVGILDQPTPISFSHSYFSSTLTKISVQTAQA